MRVACKSGCPYTVLTVSCRRPHPAQAMSLMLPKNLPRRERGQQQLPNAETLESRMDCMRITNSYGQCANSAVQLDHILDDIKCNLRKEQRTVMEQSWYTMHKVLTPIQVRSLWGFRGFVRVQGFRVLGVARLMLEQRASYIPRHLGAGDTHYMWLG